MDSTWTLHELVAEAARRIEALPAPKNGQVRAVPDERTIRYYAAIGLLDKPAAMRGRTALYSARHLAQVVAIKRLQAAGRSLADIQAMWPGMEDEALERISGVRVGAKPRASREAFWKKGPRASGLGLPEKDSHASGSPEARGPKPEAPAAVELRIELAPGITLVIDSPHAVPTAADLAALRAAVAPLVREEKKP